MVCLYTSYRYYSGLIIGALTGVSKEELLSPKYSPVAGYWDNHSLVSTICALESIDVGSRGGSRGWCPPLSSTQLKFSPTKLCLACYFLWVPFGKSSAALRENIFLRPLKDCFTYIKTATYMLKSWHP